MPGRYDAVIRPMKWWDLEQVVEIEAAVFGATAWSPESFWGELARDDRYYVVADDAGVQAYGGLWLMPPEADVQTVAVSPTARGRGLGSAILDTLLEYARGSGCRTVRLEVKAANDSAIALYESRGFRKVRVRERYYPDFSDALVMELEL
jgi:ribosomal-protein-alanine N-acetyltransferase